MIGSLITFLSILEYKLCTHGNSHRYVISNYYVFLAASDEATNNIPHKLEIEYGSTPGQKLDILGTDLPNGKNQNNLFT